MFEMRIKNSKKYDESGKQVKNLGYAPKVGASLAMLLKEHKEVKMIALGPEPVNVLVKAISHAQRILTAEGKNLCATAFKIEEVELESDFGSPRHGKAQTVTVILL